MALTKTAAFKNCVTCQRWAGTRKVGTFRDKVEFNSNSDKGECVGGTWNKTQKSAIESCNKWERWSVLK